MRVTKTLLATVRETPTDTESISHQYMLRAGIIRMLAAGIYTWLPLGLRVLRKVEGIVRQEMDRAGAQELLMPGVQPAELWHESGRWGEYGAELLRLQDRHGHDFCLGPTHEEIITDLVRREVRSYKQLPVNFYQIQSKFRDEIRPRFGIMRAREFLMKDAYSFHLSEECLSKTYELMYETYTRIFTRLDLNFRAVLADNGNIGGSLSHEFHVLADSGEDYITFSTNGDFAANLEMTPAPMPQVKRPAPPEEEMCMVNTPGIRTIEEVCKDLNITQMQCLKTLIVEGVGGGLVALVLRGDHELNQAKAEKLDSIAKPLKMADPARITRELGCSPGSLGPVGLETPVIADYDAAVLDNFVCGANKEGKHYRGVNWERDCPEPEAVDIRNVIAGEVAPDGSGELKITRGIEVGHIFQLGTKYSSTMKAMCLNKSGKEQPLIMGCYGIGISRVVAAAVEQNHDDRGIIWPIAIAPFQLVLVPINMHKSHRLSKAVERLYRDLLSAEIEVLLDDRRERPGVMFADSELLGIPHRLTVSERGLDAGMVEYRGRRDNRNEDIEIGKSVEFISSKINTGLDTF